MTDQRISIVVPCRNESGPVRQLLDELRRQNTPIHEVIVVDNASTDGTGAALEQYRRDHPDYPLKVLRCDRIGQPAALNAGICAAAGDIIVRMDAHSRPEPDCPPVGRFGRLG
ncbi:MAG: glycosyltransferase family 2 protein, partial [Acidobacteria bacterium]|nr:glycosyltransferase family 2 protein [Acidobacteriota bacterium]